MLLVSPSGITKIKHIFETTFAKVNVFKLQLYDEVLKFK